MAYGRIGGFYHRRYTFEEISKAGPPPPPPCTAYPCTCTSESYDATSLDVVYHALSGNFCKYIYACRIMSGSGWVSTENFCLETPQTINAIAYRTSDIYAGSYPITKVSIDGVEYSVTSWSKITDMYVGLASSRTAKQAYRARFNDVDLGAGWHTHSAYMSHFHWECRSYNQIADFQYV